MNDSSFPPAGWYLDGQDPRRRYWDGLKWTEHFDEAPSVAPTVHESQPTFQSKRQKLKPRPGEELDAILMAEVATWIARGWKLEGTTKLLGRSAMLREPKWRSSLRDLVLVLVTAGLWLIYIIYKALVSKTSHKIITVDRFGRLKTFRRTDKLYGE